MQRDSDERAQRQLETRPSRFFDHRPVWPAVEVSLLEQCSAPHEDVEDAVRLHLNRCVTASKDFVFVDGPVRSKSPMVACFCNFQ